jgi:hypothetical protein
VILYVSSIDGRGFFRKIAQRQGNGVEDLERHDAVMKTSNGMK